MEGDLPDRVFAQQTTRKVPSMSKIRGISEAVEKQIIRFARRTADADTVLRCRAVAAVARGHSHRQVACVLGSAPSTVGRSIARFQAGGFEALADQRRHNGNTKVTDEYRERLHAVVHHRAEEFGWQRPTWTRETLALTLAEQQFPLVAPCTLGRALSAIGARRGRPKPSVSCPWPKTLRDKTLRALRRLAKNASDEEPVVYEDEVDIHLNPKVGQDWMNRGEQRDLPTPGKNEKHYLAGALDAKTRHLLWVHGDRKNNALFLSLLDALHAHYPRARVIHVILDNVKTHSSRVVQAYLAKPDCRIQLHFLPPYCPDHNRIERRWQDLHANVTRNHRCAAMVHLLIRVALYLWQRNGHITLDSSLQRAVSVAA